jgi:hypothetical protein
MKEIIQMGWERSKIFECYYSSKQHSKIKAHVQFE